MSFTVRVCVQSMFLCVYVCKFDFAFLCANGKFAHIITVRMWYNLSMCLK